MDRMPPLAFVLLLAAANVAPSWFCAEAVARPPHPKVHRSQSSLPTEPQTAAVESAVSAFGWRDAAEQKQLETALTEAWTKPTERSLVLCVVRVTAPSTGEKLPQFSVCQPSGSEAIDNSALEACRKVGQASPQIILGHFPEYKKDAFLAFVYEPHGQLPQIVSVAQADALCAFETIQANIRGLQALEPVNDWASRVCRVAAVNINKHMQTQGGTSIFLPMDITFVADVQAVTGKSMKIKVLRQSGTTFFDRCALAGLTILENDALARLPQSSHVHGRLTVSLMEALKEEPESAKLSP
jgi:hypothetical protein